MRETLEKNLEKGLFASRWFIAPVYIILAISLGIITLKVIQEFIHVVASIVAISGINLLEIFMDIESVPDREVQWMIIVHLVFIISGVLLAVMDFIASKTSKH